MGCASSSTANAQEPEKLLKVLPTTRVLKMLVIESSKLLPSDRVKHRGDLFVVITVGDQTFRTPTAPNHDVPLFNTGLATLLDSASLEIPITFFVYDQQVFKTDDYIGRGQFELVKKLEEANNHEDVRIELTRVEDGQTIAVGSLHVNLGLYNAETIELNFWRQVSKRFAASADGKLNLLELHMLLEGLGLNANLDQVQKEFDTADVDKDGFVTPEELASYFKGRALSIAVHRAEEHLDHHRRDFQARILWQLVVSGDNSDDADSFVLGGFLTEAYAARGFGSRLINLALLGQYRVNEDNGNIFVKDRQSGQVQEERMPSYTRLAIRGIYQNYLKIDETQAVIRILKKLTIEEGKKFDDVKSAKYIKSFIDFFQLNMDEALLPATEYKTFNEFFYRKLKPGARTIVEPDNSAVVTSPADCRCTAFVEVSKATNVWIKGSTFSISTLLNSEELGKEFEGSSIVIFRLAPQDYHRFHHAVTGTLVSQAPIDSGVYYTVNPMCVRSKVNVFTENKRCVNIFDTGDANFGRVAYVCVGATLVGSISFEDNVAPGVQVKKGDPFGYFAYGGSTIIMLFKKGTIKLEDDLVKNSLEPIETLVAVGQKIGSKP